MTDYTELVKALRGLANGTWKNCEYTWFGDEGKVFADAAAAIEDLQRELNLADIAADDNARQIEELQARLGEAENSVERWKDMYLTKHEPKVGRWNAHGIDDGFLVERYTCSNCDYYSGTKKTNFCPYCGAVMQDMCEVQE